MVRRLHGIKGSGAPAPQVAPEISHSITLENDRPEAMWLGATRFWATVQTVAADATHVSIVGIRNPTGSGTLLIIERVRVGNPAAAAQRANFYNRLVSAIASVQVAANRDSRAGFNVVNFPGVFTDNGTFLTPGAYGGTILEAVQLGAGEGGRELIAVPLILAPGSEVAVVTNVANTQLQVAYTGYYRALASADLTA